MDRYALAAANLLVGNDPATPSWRPSSWGRRFRFTADATVAVAGADMPPKIDGVEQPGCDDPDRAGGAGAVLRVPQGGRTRLRRGVGWRGRAGRSRLAVDLSARRLGGHEGRALKAGDVLAVAHQSGSSSRAPPFGEPPPRGSCAPVLRMLPGLYWHRITDAAGKHFFEDTWKVAPEADRIGYRFRGGRPLEFVPRKQPSAPAPTVQHRR